MNHGPGGKVLIVFCVILILVITVVQVWSSSKLSYFDSIVVRIINYINCFIKAMYNDITSKESSNIVKTHDFFKKKEKPDL